MTVNEISTGKSHQVEITPVEKLDYKSISKRRYFFDWNSEQDYEVYKLRIVGTNEILGLVSLERIPEEWRVHIRLLTVSKENQGKEKRFDRIAGNLIAYAAKIAVRDFAQFACISLKPKSQIVRHYIDTYNMSLTGLTLSLEVPEILELIKKYDHE